MQLRFFIKLEYFLPDDDYDSDDFDFLEYDLVEKLDEINTEQSERIIEEMEKDEDTTVDDKEDNIIIEKEDDIIIEDEINEINNNLQKRKRKRSKKILLQADIDKLRSKLHANKYFMEEITPELVRCKCGKEIRLDRKFRDKNLTTHGELSSCKYSNEGQPSIKAFFKPKKIRVEEENIIVKRVACKRLYEEKYQEYVLNSPAEFGGSIRPDIAAKELFPEVIKASLRLKSLDKTTLSVRSKMCENFTTRELGICDECDKLRKNSRLNQATKKQRATGKNIRFIPKWYLEHPLSKLLLNTNLKSLWVSADNNDNDAELWFKLAQFGKDGLFKGERIFQELASLMIQIQEKKLQDKKMTGLRYSEYLKQFFCLLSDSSCEYEIFRQMFAGMSIRSIRYMRANESDIISNPELVYENILKVVRLTKALNWNGPIVGMTDYTKVQPKLTYSDELGCIVGSTLKLSETSVQTYDDIHKIINNIKQKKAIATQVRVVVLKIPIEKIPPIVIAILPTNRESNATAIYDLLMNVLIMSRDAGINLISLGSDGAPVEFNAQRLIMNGEKAESFFEFHDNYYNVHFQMPMYRNLPIITVQDPKHARKTARNQLHSGARLLVLGNNVILYRYLLTLAQAKDHAIYIRDVVNVDKQDDGAAYRLFHSDILEQIYQNEMENNEMRSLFVYLFVLGDLFDSYLNRNIFHKERIIMAMRGYFFLKMWAKYIENAGQLYDSKFSISKNFISSQSFKIFTSLAESLILLIISHHEFYPLYPLYPWEHGTEAIEHLFGISRQITNDFSFYEFFKIQQRVAYRDKIIRQDIQIQKEKTSASGYVFDFNPNSISNKNIDILRIWPDDNAIYDAIKIAYNDAAGFIKALGIKLLNDKTIPHFYISTSHHSMIISNLLNNNDDFDVDNVSGFDFNSEEINLNDLNENSFTSAASEVARLSRLADLTESESNEVSELSDSSKTELDYIINTTTKLSSLTEFQQNELFDTNGSMNISQIIQTRTSHNAFSRSERPCQNRRLNAIQLSNNQEEFNRNSANLLISEFFLKDENIGLPQYINAPNISRANVTDNNPLRENGFILYISKESIFLGKVLSLYRLVSMRHAYVSFSQDIDSLSYISVATFVNTDGNLFSPICKSGGKIFAHITSKQVIYHFDNSCLDVINVANLPGRLCLEGNSWEIFDFFSQKQVISIIAIIFH
ncbi:hypothetical protein GLOIN_2v1777971 [Rhizophagus clarus]|uniref:Uncharacterized protein n=1 Tax=Rhizophagus clarus TaxID=94130 RepID=A0A8H3LCF1_9GLOM|nr:hypothetical protein GLOIN_2v1777971 [Rhizophagus clarus]